MNEYYSDVFFCGKNLFKVSSVGGFVTNDTMIIDAVEMRIMKVTGITPNTS